MNKKILFIFILATSITGYFFYNKSWDNDKTVNANTNDLAQNQEIATPILSKENKLETTEIFEKNLNNYQPIIATSIEDKGNNTITNAMNNTGLDLNELKKQHDQTLRMVYDTKNREAMQENIKTSLTEKYGEEEAQFLMILQDEFASNKHSWEELKQLAYDQSLVSGRNYHDELFLLGLQKDAISSDDILLMIQNGYQLKDNSINMLASKGKADVVSELLEKKASLNLGYEDPITGANAITQIVKGISRFPNKYSVNKAENILRKMISLGIETKPQNGSYDPLDYALRVNPSNAKLQLAMAKILLESGVPFEESHRQLIAKMREGDTKEEFLSLISNY